MNTLEIELVDQKALKLLQDMELNLVRVVRKKSGMDALGKQVQTSLLVVVEELLSAALPTMDYTRLNTTEYGYIIANSLAISGDQSSDVTLFGQVTNAADHVSNLRSTSWCRQ